ncbi:baseplate multidomain protein megatron [Tropicimonas isoalkanivorans]|uniref:Putative phage tail protein n=1 Tax=Tropicimonas isoalkanivorans TaxID=441112 RepID=A0A1I1JBD9_9RHOB|nr:glycoside hydrolase TIM-barrel-like domain-containing protein [Tropicimonas isoalkanivorans]SFC45431.1 Putative phage tail protein [Tropicimonas isoalkanivorans]
MATLVLGAAGAAIGGSIGGAILGVSAATIGGFIGSTIGSYVDSWIISSLTPGQSFEGQRLDTLNVTSATEGAVLPRVWGRLRMGTNIIWATDFREKKETTTQGGGGKGGGGGGKVKTTEYFYFASFALAICEGPITGVGRIWADGALMDLSGVTWRWYPGDESQSADPFISAKMGAANTPAYRGTAYLVFEDLELTGFGNRIPQINVEVFRPLAEADTAEGLVRAITLIPASGEFVYSSEAIRKSNGAENLNASSGTPDMVEALDRLEASAPNVESVSLVVSWFGDDLRCGSCQIRPGVELSSKSTKPETWSVNGVGREAAHLVSRDDEGRPVYGGTPADFSVVQAIQELKARGKRVAFYPFLMMDVPGDNTLPDPYSDNAAGTGQPAFPWRGRITCSPAVGYAGTVDKTAEAADQVSAFFDGIWGFRRVVMHYASLCESAGGVDAFIIGSEMRGLTTIRDGAASYPAVTALRQLAEDVRAILGASTQISYAADWSEYFGHHPNDGSGDVFFHLDPLWADPEIDFIGIDNYMPLSDWRDGFEHLDAQAGWPAIYDRAYLQSNIAGGEGFDWFYASEADRAAQIRTPITDGAAGKPWVFRYKDLWSWWSNAHHNRPGGIESGTATAWVPESKPIRFTELGCPAIDRGTNQPNVFYDPKSSESELPHFSRGWRDDAIQRAYLEATYLFWGEAWNNLVSSVYGGRMVEVADCAAWTWDARPYPFFPELTDVWSDGENWRLGHWLTGRLGSASLAALVRDLCLRAGLTADQIDVSGLWGAVEGYAVTGIEAPRKALTTLGRHFGFDAVESEGVIRFFMRGRAAVATLSLDDLVAADTGEPIELTRAQETELPQALKWSVTRADEDYDAVVVETRRITVESSRISSESFPMAVPAEEAERRCRRALMEAWVGRETASFRLPPSRLALDPTDVVVLDHDDRLTEYRLTSVADGEARNIEVIRQDRATGTLAPGTPRRSTPEVPVVFGEPEVVLLDLPQISEDVAAHRPLIAAYAAPWPGEIAVWRSASEDGFEWLTGVTQAAQMGLLVSDLWSGPISRFDHGNELIVDLSSGTLGSVADLALFAGANAFAVESAPGAWEILQAGTAELLAEGRYRLTRLLRGQRGTEHAIGNPAPAGARVVVLDASLAALPVSEAELGIAWNWRIGPASHPVSGDTYVAKTFTPSGAGLRPFSVAHVEQPWRRPRTPDDLTIRWVQRSRALSADSWAALEVPMTEQMEAYEVEILDGATVLRTLTTTTTSVLYTAAQQIADWGAPLGPGDSLSIRIFQLSALVGRGAPKTETLYF